MAEKRQTGGESATATGPAGAQAEEDFFALAMKAGGANGKGLPPVHLWDPEHCGDIDMAISRDGRWWHQGSPIGRQRLVKLFSTILRRDDDAHYLVTPVEKVIVRVEDAPFIAVEMQAKGEGKRQVLAFRTNVDDVVEAGPDHPIRMEIDPDSGEPSPYVHVRARLEARINRPVFYDLVELGAEADIDGERMFGVWSGGTFFPFSPAAAVQAGGEVSGAANEELR